MKRDEYTLRICKPFCTFYKEGREEFLCETYKYLTENYTIEELSKVPLKLIPDFSDDKWIRKNICNTCEFITDGCAFREGKPSPPCGGYVIIEWLRKHFRRGHIQV